MRLGQGCHKRTPQWCWAVMLVFAMGVLPGAALVLSTEPLAPSWASVDAKHRVVDKQPRRPNFGGEVNSDVGVAGQIAIDEANFDVDPQRSIEQRLSQHVTAQFTNLPLHEALAVISRQIDLLIEIDLEGVAAEGVTSEHPVTLAIEETSADNALRLLLETYNLRYSLEDNMVVVSGISSAPIFPAVYNIADLLKHDLDWLDQPGVAVSTHRSLESRAAATLVASIIEQVKPASWSEMGGQGGIEVFQLNHSLVVSQTEPVHRKVAAFLAETRKRLGISAEVPRKPPLYRRTSKQELRQNVNISTKVYNVGDLVIPVPSVFRAPEDLPRYGKIPNDVQPDFETLVDLITTTIFPDTWKRVGRGFRIEPLPTSLCLVITQEERVHREISDLVEQLRRMQDVQITIETHVLHLPKSLLPPDKLPGFAVRDVAVLDARGGENVGGPTQLSATEVVSLLQTVEQVADCRIVSVSKITLFNCQQTQVTAEENGLVKSTIQYQATSSADLQSVFLKVASDANTPLDERASEIVGSGGSLLLQIDESIATAWNCEATKVGGISHSQYIADVSRLFDDPPAPTEYIHLLLVTPTVIVVGE